jgi:dTDP-4-amino-4,6-dideoxygalactose transaminase
MIRLAIPSIEAQDLEAVRGTLESGFLVQGARVAEFERLLQEYIGVRHVIAVSNCTAALHLSLLAVGVRAGDLALVTTYSYVATANVIELCGAEPVFVDIEPDTFNMNPECLAVTLARLMANDETARRVKVILPVHTFGQMADMPAILEIANRYHLPVIEDAACALGARWQGRQAGTWGALGCFSFHPRKAITTGEGGAITTNDDALAHKLRALRNHGQDPDASAPDFIMPGFNYRLTEFQAALGVTQMEKLDRIIAARRSGAERYDGLLANSPVRPPVVANPAEHVYQSYVVLLPEAAAPMRQDLIQQLRSRGIETNIGTWHMPLTTFFRTRYGFRPGDFPVADAVFARSLTLPLHEALTEGEQDTVIEHLTVQLRRNV